MAVPDFQSLMLPLLQFVGDGKEHSLGEARDSLAAHFGLSKSDREELLASGRQTRFANRVAWAKGYLQQAGLLVASRRAHFMITNRGLELLQSPPPRVDIRFLERYPEFVEFRRPKEPIGSPEEVARTATEESETPEEVLESAYGRMKAGLVSEVLARVKAASPEFFERLVVELLLKMGYGGSRKDAGQAIGKAGDEGIDGVISEDRLGLDIVYLQAKKWETSVGRPDIQKFVGALQGKRARKGVFITTASFSSEAISYVDRIDPKVVLIDGRRLAELMIDFEVGVATARTYSVKRLDSDYFDEG